MGRLEAMGGHFWALFIFALKMIYFLREEVGEIGFGSLCWAHVGPLLGHVGVVLGLD